MIIITKLLKKDLSKLRYGGSVLVVVPTTSLKEQWQGLIEKRGYKGVEVQVINTVSLTKDFKREVDLLILDEVHLFLSDQFQRVFTRVSYVWFLGLSATLERMDGRHILFDKVAPIVDTITQKEAIMQGWISDFIEFNLAVPITRKEAEIQVDLGKQIRFYMSRFGGFDNMLACMKRANAIKYADYLNLKRSKDEEPYTAQDVFKWATQGIRNIHTRKTFLDNTEHKIKAAYELITEFNIRTITFSQSTAFADELATRLTDAKVYHSSLASETRLVEKTKLCKTSKTTESLRLKLISKGCVPRVKKVSNGWALTWEESKNISGPKVAKENLDLFIQGKVKNLITAKALDQGLDAPDVQLGVAGSRSENPGTYCQICGRISRNYIYNGKKVVKVMVNLYVPDWSVPNSRDEQKLRKAQSKNSERPIWVDDLDELKLSLHKILKSRNTTL
jgi:superfamily II DNA or RNA helicase